MGRVSEDGSALKFRHIALSLSVAAAPLAGGCTRYHNTQGYIADPELVGSVKAGVDNKESVAKSLGRPSIAAQWTDNRWYYITRETRQIAFRDPRPVKQSVLAISFDAKGNVTKVQKNGLEIAANIAPSSDVTPTLGKKHSFWNAVFGNIGRVGAGPTAGPDSSNTGGGGPNGP